MRLTKEPKESENLLLDDRQLRDKCVGRYEVLDKVKKLLLLPNDLMTLKQIAEYYEVEPHAIEMICSRNANELNSDGMTLMKIKDFLNSPHVRIEKEKYKTTFYYENGTNVSMSNRGLKVFPRRAILRVGMLLRDSDVAKEVRTQLLNIEEKTSTETKIQDIMEEQKLMFDIGRAVFSGDASAVAIASSNLVAFKNRHIEKLQNENNKLSELYDDLINTEDLISINTMAKELGIGEYKLFDFMRENKILFYDSNNMNIPYERFRKEGKFAVKETLCCDGKFRSVTYATKKGLDYVRKLLRKNGYYPVTE